MGVAHAAIERRITVNDYILDTIDKTPTGLKIRTDFVLNKRYPLRVPPKHKNTANVRSNKDGCSINAWIVNALYHRVKKEGWLRGDVQKKAS